MFTVLPQSRKFVVVDCRLQLRISHTNVSVVFHWYVDASEHLCTIESAPNTLVSVNYDSTE